MWVMERVLCVGGRFGSLRDSMLVGEGGREWRWKINGDWSGWRLMERR